MSKPRCERGASSRYPALRAIPKPNMRRAGGCPQNERALRLPACTAPARLSRQLSTSVLWGIENGLLEPLLEDVDRRVDDDPHRARRHGPALSGTNLAG